MTTEENDLLASYEAPPLPTVNPETGEVFVSHELHIRNDHERHQLMPPIPPSQEYDEYDDDGCIERSIVLTDEQFALAMANYEKADAEWRKTHGEVFVRGAVRILATFKTANGTAEAVTAPGAPEWRFTRWESRTPATRA